MNINNAILHVFDFVSCVNVFAQAPMDLGNKAAKRYVTSQAKRALGNLDSKRGTFAENSLFAEELRAYFRGERDFVGLSQQIGEFIVGELSRMEKTPSTDLLVVDFEGDADQTVREMTDEETRLRRWRRSRSSPPTTWPCGSWTRSAKSPVRNAGSFPMAFLQCSMEASSREVLEAVTTVVEEVAEEFGANTAVALSRAKAYVAENAEESDEVDARELGREVFADQPPRRRALRSRCGRGRPARARRGREGRGQARHQEPQDSHRHGH